jgi:hypothetical protein
MVLSFLKLFGMRLERKRGLRIGENLKEFEKYRRRD